MNFTTLIILALGLSMDAFAVSVSNTMCYTLTKRQAAASSVAFGLFQGLMPVIGYFAGQLLARWINAFDHWIALILLGIIGGKMLFGVVNKSAEGKHPNIKRTRLRSATTSAGIQQEAIRRDWKYRCAAGCSKP